MNILEINMMKNLYLDKDKVPIVIYGAGMNGYAMAKVIIHLGLNLLCFVDSDVNKIKTKICDKEVKAPKCLEEIKEFHLIVSVGENYYDEVYNDLIKKGFKKNILMPKLYPTLWNFEDAKIVMEKVLKLSSKKAEIYENFYKQHYLKYESINLFYLNSVNIGEFIPRVLNILDEDCSSMNSKESLNLFVTDTQISNKFLIKLVGKHVNVTKNLKDIFFWEWVLSNHKEKINLNNFQVFNTRTGKTYFAKKYEKTIEIPRIDEEKGALILSGEGLRKELVPFHCRDELYGIQNTGIEDKRRSDCRNSSFENFKLALEYVNNINMTAIRMGKIAKPLAVDMDIVDYTNKFHSDFMDFYLISRAKFFVGTCTGLIAVPGLFGIPKIIANTIPVAPISNLNTDGVYTKYDIFIPKKYWLKSEKRLLSLEEMYIMDKEAAYKWWIYEEKDIELIENTPQEILDVVEEMNLSLDGHFYYTEEDVRLQKQYEKCVRSLCIKLDLDFNDRMPIKIGAKFLKENKFLLEAF